MPRKAKETAPAPAEPTTTPAPAKRTRKKPTDAPEAVLTPTESKAKPAARKKPSRTVAAEVVSQESEATASPARGRKSAKSVRTEVKSDIQAAEEALRPVWRKPGQVKAKADVVTPEPITEAPPAAKKTTARRGKKSTPALDVIDPEGRLTVLEWRAKSERPAAAATPAEADDLAPRRTRGRKRREAPADDVAADSPKPAPRGRRREDKPDPVVPSSLPPVPTRVPIPIPENAAQVIMRDGRPTLIRNRQVYPPIWFFAGAPDETRLATVLEEAKMAAENGIHVFSTLVELEVAPSSVSDAVAFAGYFVRRLHEVDPDCQVILRVVFTAPGGWETDFPSGKNPSASSGPSEPSICDDAFWGVAEDCLKEFVRLARQLPNAESIMGIHLERGEWFSPKDAGYDRSLAAHDKFREWLRHRYRNDVVTLRAAWFDGSAQFETVTVPEVDRKSDPSEGFVRTGRKSRRAVDYHLFLSDVTTERLYELAYAVKSASEGTYLVGASYGYTFEWSHPANGHLALGKLLRCPDLDYIAGPPSYRNREPGGTAAMPGPIDSFVLNGKLYISEEDYKTPISGRQEPDDFNPVMKTPQALESVHWRGAGLALAHGTGVCWMDSWGNGWLSSRGIWQRGHIVRDGMTMRQHAALAEPEVAVFIDERSLSYLFDERAFEVLVQEVRESILRSGLSVGFYLLSDLAHRENFPEAKLYVFLNAWDIRPEVRSAIKSRLQRNDKVLFWLYSAGLFEGGRESLERVREVTGIALRPQPFNSRAGTTILNFRHPLCQGLPERLIAEGGELEPSYFAIPEDAQVLGEYTQTGLPSFVVRRYQGEDGPHDRWTSVFLGEPIVTPSLFRALGQMAGAHVWNFGDDLVHACSPYLTVHCTGAGLRTITLPDKWTAYSLTASEWAHPEGNSVKFQALDGSTHTFLVGHESEIAALLAVDRETPIHIEEDLVRAENTVHWEMIKFDVPIMKLDEWVEETWSDELADDLLLKPSMLDIDLSQPDSPDEGPRHSDRRRRRRRGDRGSEETANSRQEGADREAHAESGIHFMFRKRD